MRIAAYLRVSTEEQREKQTIDNQRYEIERWASYHRHEVVAWYPDDGVSGTIPMELRESGGKLYRDLGGRTFDAVVILKTDRIARSALQTLRFVEALKLAETKLLSATENIDPETSQGTMFLNMLATFAQYEHQAIRERTMNGAARAAREGRWNGGRAPFGYRVAGDRDKRDRRLAVVDEQADIVRDIFGRYLGGENTIEVASYVRATYDVPARHDWISSILKSRTYAGEYVWRKNRWFTEADGQRKMKRRLAPDEWITHPCPSIVDWETFDAAQAQLKRNFALGIRNAKRLYMLRGLLRCARCGGSVVGTSRSNGRAYYHCIGRQRGQERTKACGLFLRSDAVEVLVWADVEAWLRNPRRKLAEVAARHASAVDPDAVEKQRRRLAGTLADKEAERERVVTMVQRGLIGFGEGEARIERIKSEAAGVRAQLEAVGVELDRARGASERVLTAEAVLRRIAERVKAGYSDDDKRAIIGDVVVRVDVGMDVFGPKRGQRKPILTIHDRL